MIYTHKVHYYETDKMGITHHSNYIRWMEEARVAYLDSINLSYAKLEETGIISPVTSVECNYKKTSTFDDVISIKVYVTEFKGVKLKLKYEMTNEDGEVCVIATSMHCFLNAEGSLINIRKEYPDIYDILSNEVERQ